MSTTLWVIVATIVSWALARLLAFGLGLQWDWRVTIVVFSYWLAHTLFRIFFFPDGSEAKKEEKPVKKEEPKPYELGGWRVSEFDISDRIREAAQRPRI